MRVGLSISLSLDQAGILEQLCKDTGANRSTVIAAAIREYANNNNNNNISTRDSYSEDIREEKEKSKTRANNNINIIYSPDFESFWAQYPRKVGKGAAWVSWQRDKKPYDAIATALAWQCKSKDWTKDGGKYVPNPATYLNQRRWEDEPDKKPDIFANSIYPELG